MSRNTDIAVRGKTIDGYTRCIHYHSPLDVIAIKFKCCDEYYPCYDCHREAAGHKSQLWKQEEFDTKAIFCGICNHEMTIREYLESGDHCPSCNAAFNPNCSKHYHLYFEM